MSDPTKGTPQIQQQITPEHGYDARAQAKNLKINLGVQEATDHEREGNRNGFSQRWPT